MQTTGHSSKVIWHTTMSLDGFIADPAEQMDWVFDLDFGEGITVAAGVERLGALLVGRHTMDVENRQQPGFYGGSYRGPFFVLSDYPQPEPPTVKGVQGTSLSVSVEDAVAIAREAAGVRDVGILGAKTATAALQAGLVDEIVVQVAPLLLGEGIPLYRGGVHRLRLLETYRDGDLTTLRFSTRLT